MRVGIDLDQTEVYVEAVSGTHTIRTPFDAIAARALADQLYASAEVLEEFTAKRMAANP